MPNVYYMYKYALLLQYNISLIPMQVTQTVN